MNLLMKITKKGETRDNGIAGNDINSLCYLKIVLPVSSKLPKISLCNSKTDFLENKMFYFSDITGFSEDAVKCHAQIMSQNFVLQPGT